jgi:hypothetical protein
MDLTADSKTSIKHGKAVQMLLCLSTMWLTLCCSWCSKALRI